MRVIRLTPRLLIPCIMAPAVALAASAPVQVVSVSGVEYVTLRQGSNSTLVRISGISGPRSCYADIARDWAAKVLAVKSPLYLLATTGQTDEQGIPVVRIGWKENGSWVDYGWAAIRAGAAMNAQPVPDDAVQATYAAAEDEAKSESRGRWSVCVSPLEQFQTTARTTGVPANVLYGIAMNESGYHGRPWPWTLNVAGKAYYFRDRIAAWRAATWLVAQNVRMFDIGLMQVNYKYNGYRFHSLWDAFQPETNRQVAARILAENLKARNGNWAQAIGLYHSAEPARSQSYVQRFIEHYRQSMLMPPD